MKAFGILATTTIRANRLANCTLTADKYLINKGHGSSSFRTDVNSETRQVRWFDNKSVQLASTFSSAAVSATVKRWDATSKKYTQMPCPETLKGIQFSYRGC